MEVLIIPDPVNLWPKYPVSLKFQFQLLKNFPALYPVLSDLYISFIFSPNISYPVIFFYLDIL